MTDAEIEKLDGRELDYAVQLQVMGSVPCESASHKPGGALYDLEPQYCCALPGSPDQGAPAPLYSWDLNDAFRVMRARPEWQWTMREWRAIEMAVSAVVFPVGYWIALAESKVSALDGDWTRAWCVAICRAALKAVQVQA